MRSSFLQDLIVSVALGVVCGGAVGVVYQDATIALPFVVLGVLASPLVGAARNASRPYLLRLGGVVIAAGAVAITYGWFFAPDGPVNALGVLGGTALSALGLSITSVAAILPRSRSARG